MSIAFTTNPAAAETRALAPAAAIPSKLATSLARAGDWLAALCDRGHTNKGASDSDRLSLPLLQRLRELRLSPSCVSAALPRTDSPRGLLETTAEGVTRFALRQSDSSDGRRVRLPGWTPRPRLMAPLEVLNSTGGSCAAPPDPLMHSCVWGVAACLAGPNPTPPVAPFLVDTGATATVIPPGMLTDSVRRESRIGTAAVMGAAGKTKRTPCYVLPLHVGDGKVTTPAIESDLAGDVGILGVAGPLTKSSIVELDPGAERFCLYDANEGSRAALNLDALAQVPPSACRFDDNGFVYVTVTVGDRDVGECLLDTGCNAAVSLPNSERETVAKALGPAWGQYVSESKTVHGAAGPNEGEFWRGKISVGGVPLGNQTITIAARRNRRKNAATRLLGMPTLHDKRVVVDYADKKLYIGRQSTCGIQ